MTPKFYPKNKDQIGFSDFPPEIVQCLIQNNGAKRLVLRTYMFRGNEVKTEFQVFIGETLKHHTTRLDSAIFWYNQL